MLLSAALLASLAGGCSVVKSPVQQRGHRVDEDMLKELTPGTSTKADVQALLGSPTKRASFDDNVWIYMASVTRMRIGRYPALDSQDVTVVTFSPQGTLQNIDKLTKEDALPVDVVERVTPTPGSEQTFLQQLFGNVARLNPSIPIGGGGKIGGGAP